MSQPKSGASRIILLVVAVAIAAVVIAKVSSTRHRSQASSGATTTGSQAVRRIAAEVPPDSTRVGRPETPASPSTEAPQAAPSPRPEPPTSQASAAAPAPKPGRPAAPSPAAEAPSPRPPQPAPAAAQPAAPERTVDPLPGSDLAACLKNGKVTFVDFGAGWCKACKQMEPVIHKLAADYQGKANIVYVDTDKYPQIAQSYHIAAIPNQIVFNTKGEKTTDHLGYWPIEDVTKALAAAGVR